MEPGATGTGVTPETARCSQAAAWNPAQLGRHPTEVIFKQELERNGKRNGIKLKARKGL